MSRQPQSEGGMSQASRWVGCLRRVCVLRKNGKGRELRPSWQRALSEEGATLVEMGLSSVILMAMLFGIFEMSLALYTYHFVSDIARQGTRYAIVRGSASCGNTPALSNCNATGANIQTYLRSLSFPNIIPANLTATTTWYTISGSTYTLCTTTPPACNLPQNAVQVAVTYAYPLNIPFVTNTTLNLTSSSRMVISQ